MLALTLQSSEWQRIDTWLAQAPYDNSRRQLATLLKTQTDTLATHPKTLLDGYKARMATNYYFLQELATTPQITKAILGKASEPRQQLNTLFNATKETLATLETNLEQRWTQLAAHNEQQRKLYTTTPLPTEATTIHPQDLHF